MIYSLKDLLKENFKSLKGKKLYGIPLYSLFYGASISGSKGYRTRYTLIYIPIENPSEFEKVKEILGRREDWEEFNREDVIWAYIKKHTIGEELVGWSIISLLKLKGNLFLELFVREPVEKDFLKEIKGLLMKAILKDR